MCQWQTVEGIGKGRESGSGGESPVSDRESKFQSLRVEERESPVSDRGSRFQSLGVGETAQSVTEGVDSRV